MNDKDIQVAIRAYSEAYNRLESFQDRKRLQIGDQKTGVIGEYYAKIYLQKTNPDAIVEYAPTNKSYDIICKKHRNKKKIQVKTVSDHSRTSRVSPIHTGYDELFLLRLDRNFKPVGLWVLGNIGYLAHRTMPKKGVLKSGSVEFRGGEDRLEELLHAISNY